MIQCHSCRGYLFFAPFPADIFACCSLRGESVKNIDLKKGVSRAIWEHGIRGHLCLLFKPGKSVCHVSWRKPFALSQTRKEGEEYIRSRL